MLISHSYWWWRLKMLAKSYKYTETERYYDLHFSRASEHFEAIVGQLVDSSVYISKRRWTLCYFSQQDGEKIIFYLSLKSFLIRNEAGESQSQKWKNTIITLVREVVSSVDPNVRKGDSLDVRPYVKLKIIPGKDHAYFLCDLIYIHTISDRSILIS